MNWTTRLKRHGGLLAIGAKRRRQLVTLRGISEFGRRGDDAKNATAWLQGNALRVLGLGEERYFRMNRVVFR